MWRRMTEKIQQRCGIRGTAVTVKSQIQSPDVTNIRGVVAQMERSHIVHVTAEQTA